MWPFSKRMTKKQKENETTVQRLFTYATAERVEDIRDPHVRVLLMELRLWGFNREVDRILPRLHQDARASLGAMDFFLLPLEHSPSPALAARAIAARPEALSSDQVSRLQRALTEWVSR